MDKDLFKLLEESKIDKKDYNEISIVVSKFLNTKYSEKVIMEQLLHKASFDENVFWRYWKQESAKKIKSTCGLAKHDKAMKFGFCRNSALGGFMVGLVDYFFEN